MKEQLITFKTSKLAKEKGFKEYCKSGYLNNKCIEKYHVAGDGLKDWGNYNKESSEFTHTDNAEGFFIPLHEPYYKTPTQSLLQKWLRDKHKLHVNPRFNGIDKYDYIINLDISNRIFDSYEEALEKGLVEALKIIK
jgi:hypothetical protein